MKILGWMWKKSDWKNSAVANAHGQRSCIFTWAMPWAHSCCRLEFSHPSSPGAQYQLLSLFPSVLFRALVVNNLSHQKVAWNKKRCSIRSAEWMDEFHVRFQSQYCLCFCRRQKVPVLIWDNKAGWPGTVKSFDFNLFDQIIPQGNSTNPKFSA